jgi:hypothetical protein
MNCQMPELVGADLKFSAYGRVQTTFALTILRVCPACSVRLQATKSMARFSHHRYCHGTLEPSKTASGQRQRHFIRLLGPFSRQLVSSLEHSRRFRDDICLDHDGCLDDGDDCPVPSRDASQRRVCSRRITGMRRCSRKERCHDCRCLRGRWLL